MSNSSFLRVAVLPTAGIFDLSYSAGGEIKVVGGYESKLLEALSQGLKIKFVVVTPKDGEWGRLNSQGDWTGTIGLIVRKEADLAISWLTVTEERLKVVDFSYPYYNEDVTFATQEPAELPAMMAFIHPISGQFWMLAIILLVLPCVFRLVLTNKQSFSELLLRVFGSLLRQPFEISIGQSFKENSLFVSWIFAAMFLSTAYTAVVLASMTVPLRETGIQTIDQLCKVVVVSKEYKCAVYKGTVISDNLRHSNDQSLMKIGEWIKENQGYIDPKTDDVMDFVTKTRSALIAPRIRLQDVLHGAAYISKDSFYSGSLAVAARKDFKIKAKLDRLIIRIREAGLYEKSLNDKRFSDFLNYSKSSQLVRDVQPKQLSTSDLMGVFIMHFCGLTLALTVFIIEVVRHSIKIGN